MMLIKKFGASIVPWACVTTGVFLILIIMIQVQKFVKITPKCILEGLKFATGKNKL